MLFLINPLRSQALRTVKIRQRRGFFLRLVVPSLFIDRGKARESHNLIGSAEGMPRADGVDLHRVIPCVRHLAGHKAAPDQLVQPVLFLGQVVLDALRVKAHVAGTDRFVRVLRAFLLAETAGRSGVIRDAVAVGNQFPGRRQRLFRQAQGVGTHIGNQAHGAFPTDFHTLIELLRDRHGAPRRHIEFA